MHSLKKCMASETLPSGSFPYPPLECLQFFKVLQNFFLSILAFAHRQVAHSFVLLIDFFHFVPHVLIFSKCWKGNNQVSYL